jgi:hypothetical protein
VSNLEEGNFHFVKLPNLDIRRTTWNNWKFPKIIKKNILRIRFRLSKTIKQNSYIFDTISNALDKKSSTNISTIHVNQNERGFVLNDLWG